MCLSTFAYSARYKSLSWSHLTQCGLGRGLPLYQVTYWSSQPFGHNRQAPQSWSCCAPFSWGWSWLPAQTGCCFAVLSLFGLNAQHMKWTANLQTRIKEHGLSCVLECFDCHVRHSQFCPPRSCGTVVAVQSLRCVALIRVWLIHSLWPIRWNSPCNCKSVRHITQSILRKR